MLTNPTVIFEVLSESTEWFDRGSKFSRYRDIEALEECILIAQDRPRVKPFFRLPDGMWGIGKIVDGLDAAVKLRSVPIEPRMAGPYAGVAFPSDDMRDER